MTRAAIVAHRLGESAFNAIVENVEVPCPMDPEEKRKFVADVLAAASEYGGVKLPFKAPKLNDKLTVKGFPGGVPALTTKGLAEFYASKGWTYMVLRIGPLVRGFMGQTERLQEVLALYEAQCAAEGVTHLPPFADGPHVAGGTEPHSAFSVMLDGVGTDEQ